MQLDNSVLFSECLIGIVAQGSLSLRAASQHFEFVDPQL